MQSPAVGNTPSETPDQFAVHIRKVAFMIETAAYVSVILLAAMAFLAVWKRQNLIRLLRVNALFSERMIVRNFSNMKQIFFHDELAVTGSDIAALPKALQPLPDSFVFAGNSIKIADWRVERKHTAMVVLKNGEIAYEDYFLGTKDSDLRISWSMAKSILSIAFGVAVSEGLIEDLDDPVAKYVSKLDGSAYECVTIRNVLNMASGIEFNEDYLDFKSDIKKMGRVLALGKSMDGFAKGQKKRARAAGLARQYTSIDTHVLGMVLRSVTGLSAQDYVGEKVLRPIGLEANPIYLTDGYGVAFVLGGLNMRTRDFARIGLMMAQDGVSNGRRVVSVDWVRASTCQSAPEIVEDDNGNLGYGYQWWLPPQAQEGEFFAAGIYGQYIYVNRPKNTVIALNSADRAFKGTDRDITHMNLTMFRTITDNLT